MKKVSANIFLFIILLSYSACQSGSKTETSELANSCFDTIFPVIYNCKPAENGDYAFRTIPAALQRIKLIPNMESRQQMQMNEIKDISGVHQFFLDHDLVSGFVHPYTQYMFEQLRTTDFVLKYSPDNTKRLTGTICFIRKSEIATIDTLGKTIGFFRQCRLSEVDYKEEGGEQLVKMDTCKFYSRCMCPQSKVNFGNTKQIPFMHKTLPGYQALEQLSGFGDEDGGTVVLVWENKKSQSKEILFQDIHSSWQEVFKRALEVSKEYNTDPAICISDAGPFARKLRANEKAEINVERIDQLAPNGKKFGAGYGYVIPPKKTK